LHRHAQEAQEDDVTCRVIGSLRQFAIPDRRSFLDCVYLFQRVRGLDVAMDDPLLVRVLDGVADLHEKVQSVPCRKPLKGAAGLTLGVGRCEGQRSGNRIG
jgi:hypothetical protein